MTDATGEAFYLRDEQSGDFWSPTPLPVPGAMPYVIRHGFGYSVFEHAENGLLSELTVYVAMDAPVKFSVLKLRNASGRPRRISITGFWEWVLGEQRQKNLLHVQTEVDHKTGALLARNFYNADFSEAVAFVDVADSGRTLTGDREEFLGRNGICRIPRRSSGSTSQVKRGQGWILAEPCKSYLIWRTERNERSGFAWELVGTWRTRKTWSDAFAKAMPAERH